jgi:hypothetical protein
MIGRFRLLREKVYINNLAFAESNGMLFFETSAKSDIGINEMFRTIANKMYGS